jgi:hypothetical protein
VLARSKNEEVQRLIARGKTAISHKDPAELATVNALLRKRLPKDRPTSTSQWFSTVDQND